MIDYSNYDQNFIDSIVDLMNTGLSNSEMFTAALTKGYKGSRKSFNNFILRLKKRIDWSKSKDSILAPIKNSESQDDKFIKILKEKQIIKMFDLCNIFNCSPNKIKRMISKYRNQGYEIGCDDFKVIFSTNIVMEPETVSQIGTTEIVFGVASDLHFGSMSCQLTALNEFTELCRKRGVKHIFVPGDVTAGYNVYPGQVHDLYAISADEQIQSIVANLPHGFEWYAIGGNHDYSYITKGGGYNILSVIASRRKDFHYCGFDDANVPILNNVELKMWHPRGGVPYALSYRIQKGVEQIAFSELQNVVRGIKERPTVRFVLSGHLHIQMQGMFGSIMGMQCGCFEGTTNYLKRLGLVPTVGGWIVKATLDKVKGTLKNFEAKFYIFDEIDNDWENYSHTNNGDYEIDKPIFEV